MRRRWTRQSARLGVLGAPLWVREREAAGDPRGLSLPSTRRPKARSSGVMASGRGGSLRCGNCLCPKGVGEWMSHSPQLSVERKGCSRQKILSPYSRRMKDVRGRRSPQAQSDSDWGRRRVASARQLEPSLPGAKT